MFYRSRYLKKQLILLALLVLFNEYRDELVELDDNLDDDIDDIDIEDSDDDENEVDDGHDDDYDYACDAAAADDDDDDVYDKEVVEEVEMDSELEDLPQQKYKKARLSHDDDNLPARKLNFNETDDDEVDDDDDETDSHDSTISTLTIRSL